MSKLIGWGVSVFVAVVGGFFSLGLWSAGFKYGHWGEGSFLGIVLFALCIGVAAIVYLLANLNAKAEAAGRS